MSNTADHVTFFNNVTSCQLKLLRDLSIQKYGGNLYHHAACTGSASSGFQFIKIQQNKISPLSEDFDGVFDETLFMCRVRGCKSFIRFGCGVGIYFRKGRNIDVRLYFFFSVYYSNFLSFVVIVNHSYLALY